MADKAKKSIWLRFFREAGIPSGYDTKYALIFEENRIKMNMLMDINKECLKDMGIIAMGDIIAILKHAKMVDEESKAQAYDVPQPTSTVVSVSQSQSAGKQKGTSSSPVGSSSSASSGSASSTSGPRSVIINTKTVGSNKTNPPSRQVAGGSVVKKVTMTPKTPIVDESNSNAKGNGNSTLTKRTTTIVRLKRSVAPPQREEVPLQKKIRVLREQEGSYIIKMPEGSTPKTHRMLQDRLGPNLGTSASAKKPTVFDRLGGRNPPSGQVAGGSVVKKVTMIPLVDESISNESGNSTVTKRRTTTNWQNH